jgi:hypothetical protein
MNTGTLISDLMATVERAETQAELRAEFCGERSAERSSEQRRIFDEHELHRIYGLQTDATQQGRVYMGAA